MGSPKATRMRLRAVVWIVSCGPLTGLAHAGAVSAQAPSEGGVILYRDGTITDCSKSEFAKRTRRQQVSRSFVSIEVDQCAWSISVDQTDSSVPAELTRHATSVSCTLEAGVLPGPVLLEENAYVRHLEQRGLERVVLEDSTRVELDGISFKHQSLVATMPRQFSPSKPRYRTQSWYWAEGLRMVTFACFGLPDEMLREQSNVRSIATTLRIAD